MSDKPYGWRYNLSGGGPIAVEVPLSAGSMVSKGDILTTTGGYFKSAASSSHKAHAVAATDMTGGSGDGDVYMKAFMDFSDVFCFPYTGTPRKPGQTCDCGGTQMINAHGTTTNAFVVTEVNEEDGLIYVRLNPNVAIDSA